MSRVSNPARTAGHARSDGTFLSRPISRRLAWLAVVLLLVNWMIAAAFLTYMQNQEQERADKRLSDTITIAKTQIEAELSPVYTALDATANWLGRDALPANRGPDANELARIRERLAGLSVAMPQGTALGVADAEGKLLTSVPAAEGTINLAKSAYFRELAASATTRAVLGAPRVGRLAPGMRMPFAMRVNRADGSFAGVVFASIAYSHLSNAIEQLSALSQSCVLLRSKAGEAIVQVGYDECAATPAIANVGTGGGGGAGRAELFPPALVSDGARGYFLTTQSLTIGSHLPLEVVVFSSEERAMAGYHAIRMRVALVSLTFAAVVLGFALMLGREFRRREGVETELKQRESSLDAQRLDLVEAQSIARLGSWTYDVATDLIMPSAEYLKIFGLTMDDFPLTMHAWLERFVEPVSMDEARQNVQRLSQALPYEGTRRILQPGGAVRYVQFKAVPFFDADGKHIGHRGVVRDITEEKRSQETLAQRTMELETAKRIGGLGAWQWNTETDQLTVDESTLQIYDVERGDAPASLLAWGIRFSDPEDLEKYREAYENKFYGQPLDAVRRIHSGKQLEKWIHTLGNPIFDPNGKLIGYQGVSRDITRQKMAEHQLAESEQKYRLITENMRDIVAIYDVDSALIFATPSLTGTLGYGVEESIGRKALAAIHRNDYAHVRAALRAMTAGATEAANVWFRYPHAAGHWVWLESVVVPFYDEKSGTRRYQATTREITLRKQAELALRASEERFRSLTELSSDWYWEQDAQHRFTFMSRDVFRWTTKAREEVLGKTRWEYHPNALTAEEWVAHRADLDARKPFYNLISKVVDADGKIIGYSSLSGQPIFGENGEFVGYRGTGQDISARKFAEDALARRTRELALSNRWLEEEARERQLLEKNFLMAIEMELAQVGLELHDDLGQDLTGIALLTKTLERRLAEAGIAASADAARISGLANRAIQHTRMISHGLSPYIWGSEGLVAALGQLAGDIDSLGEVDCEASLDKDIKITEEVVARNLYRIAQESVNNALKHGRAKRISITLSQRARNIILSVVDDGIGHAERAPDGNAEIKFHSIRHRANSINAKLSIRRGRRGGTVVRVTCSQKMLESPVTLPLLENA